MAQVPQFTLPVTPKPSRTASIYSTTPQHSYSYDNFNNSKGSFVVGNVSSNINSASIGHLKNNVGVSSTDDDVDMKNASPTDSDSDDDSTSDSDDDKNSDEGSLGYSTHLFDGLSAPEEVDLFFLLFEMTEYAQYGNLIIQRIKSTRTARSKLTDPSDQLNAVEIAVMKIIALKKNII